MRDAEAGCRVCDPVFDQENLTCVFMERSRFGELLRMTDLSGVVKGCTQFDQMDVAGDAQGLKLLSTA